MAVVVFPTPPFWFAIAITCVTGESPRIWNRVGRVDATDGNAADATPATRWAGDHVIHRSSELFTILWICRSADSSVTSGSGSASGARMIATPPTRGGVLAQRRPIEEPPRDNEPGPDGAS